MTNLDSDWEHKLSEKLTEGFIRYQWNLENPFPQPKDFRSLRIPWVDQYLSDSIFHAKVTSLVAGVMGIIIKELES